MRLLAVVLSACLVFSGCGGMIYGIDQTVQVTSEPEGVAITCQPECEPIETPGELRLKTHSDYVLKARKEGYKTETVAVKRKANPKAVAWDMVWGLFGLFPALVAYGIDHTGGGLYTLAPEGVHFDLEPREPPPEDTEEAEEITPAEPESAEVPLKSELNN